MRAIGASIPPKHIALVIILFFVWTASAVSAQVPRGAKPDVETTLVPGTIVWITDSAGREEKTRIVSLWGDVVTTAVEDAIRHLRTSDILRVRARRSDSVLNGALIGAGAAVTSGLLLCRAMEPWENCRDDVGPMLRIGAVGAGVGIAIDALIRGRKTIYEADRGSFRLHAAPILAGRARGLQLSLRF